MTEEEKREWEAWKAGVNTRHINLKEVAELVSACPHVIPAGIGIEEYFDILRNGSRLLTKYLIEGSME